MPCPPFKIIDPNPDRYAANIVHANETDVYFRFNHDVSPTNTTWWLSSTNATWSSSSFSSIPLILKFRTEISSLTELAKSRSSANATPSTMTQIWTWILLVSYHLELSCVASVRNIHGYMIKIFQC
ncbi:unnamed protein product [Didymodactylos carnosus]|uniref:Uncharacterized protein n=1 Tax=Didymodactylos carnosus TaxID=1234261 RepID=A0A8S2D8L8_9BILA|nr:unnamed protein product [Didymodactylos carnosus]CAF3686564.1 unnamed protein product [Didymodactylos carnosus]